MHIMNIEIFIYVHMLIYIINVFKAHKRPSFLIIRYDSL